MYRTTCSFQWPHRDSWSLLPISLSTTTRTLSLSTAQTLETPRKMSWESAKVRIRIGRCPHRIQCAHMHRSTLCSLQHTLLSYTRCKGSTWRSLPASSRPTWHQWWSFWCLVSWPCYPQSSCSVVIPPFGDRETLYSFLFYCIPVDLDADENTANSKCSKFAESHYKELSRNSSAMKNRLVVVHTPGRTLHQTMMEVMGRRVKLKSPPPVSGGGEGEG